MKILLRTALPALLTLVLTDLSSSALLAQEAPRPGSPPAGGWDIRVRPRVGMFMAQWDYVEERRLPRRPTAGVEVLVRRTNPRFGARLLGELTGAWGANDLVDWGLNIVDRSVRPRRVGTVVVDAVLYGVQDQDLLPYVFLGGGSRSISVEEADGIFIDPYFDDPSRSTRAATIHGGVGFEVRVGDLWAVFEVGDYYGHFLDFGRVHDIHTTLLIGLPGFGDMIEAVTTLGDDPAGERH